MTSDKKQLHPLLKLLLEMGPLVLFFIIYSKVDLRTAIVSFIPATVAALVAYYVLQRKVPVMPLVSGAIVVVFGGLTLFFDNDHFFKMKPTIVSAVFGVVLIYGYVSGRPLLKTVLDSAFNLDDAGWHKLTLRWAVYFFFMAALNEVVWRNFSESTWVSFKVFGLTALTVVFAMAQTPLLMRYEVKKDETKTG